MKKILTLLLFLGVTVCAFAEDFSTPKKLTSSGCWGRDATPVLTDEGDGVQAIAFDGKLDFSSSYLANVEVKPGEIYELKCEMRTEGNGRVGISAALGEAHVTYANEAKIRYCGVRPETLERFGAVSEETAREMAQGLRERSGADIAVATTGIAGPDGGTPEKPVGLVYVACADLHGVSVEKLTLSGSRERIRSLAALRALDMVRRAALCR